MPERECKLRGWVARNHDGADTNTLLFRRRPERCDGAEDCWAWERGFEDLWAPELLKVHLGLKPGECVRAEIVVRGLSP